MASTRVKVSVRRLKEPRQRPPASRSSSVLAERNQAVVAVGAWVEEGPDFLQHPTVLALETERLLAEKKRENERRLRRLQDGVRHRLAQRARVCHERQRSQRDEVVIQYRPSTEVLPHHRFAEHQVMDRSFEEAADTMRLARLRLAACRVTPREDVTSKLPGGEWRDTPPSHRAEEERYHGDTLSMSPHDCPLVQYKAYSLGETDKAHPDQSSKPSPSVQTLLWPLTDQEQLKKQRQSHFLKHRRLAMNSEREQVKENRRHRKHLKKTASIKAEKERLRLEEERRLEKDRQLEDVRQRLQDRELLILEKLRLQEEEYRRQELQRKKREENSKITKRYVEALRAQMKERLSQTKLELPPLCCCASSFWDSHPDTCANNCVFHNNPRAYVQALHSTVVNLELQ